MYGLTGGISISSYSPINSRGSSQENRRHTARKRSACGRETRQDHPPTAVVRLMPELRPPGREFSRFSFLSVRAAWTRFANSCRTLKLKHQIYQLLFAELLQITPVHAPWIQSFHIVARGWVNAQVRPVPTLDLDSGPIPSNYCCFGRFGCRLRVFESDS